LKKTDRENRLEKNKLKKNRLKGGCFFVKTKQNLCKFIRLDLDLDIPSQKQLLLLMAKKRWVVL
jgi:hypothetical protein